MLKDPSLACWALLFLQNYPTNSRPHQNHLGHSYLLAEDLRLLVFHLFVGFDRVQLGFQVTDFFSLLFHFVIEQFVLPLVFLQLFFYYSECVGRAKGGGRGRAKGGGKEGGKGGGLNRACESPV